RLARQSVGFEDGPHFKANAARMIRRILVDHARGRQSDKRGGGLHRVTLCEPQLSAVGSQDVDILGLDAALHKLQAINARPHSVVELHFFGGLKLTEVADLLKIAESTVHADWRFARAWLRKELGATT
ncbi:MAG: RNA polymerase sigma-70 factor (ECF subfamily), partial [Planctomycetota bacterium]